MSFYTKCMRNGSVILFWMAFIVGVMGFIGVLGSSWGMVSSGVGSPYEDHSPGAILMVLTALASALSTAAWPFFGAALLWLLDMRLANREAAE
ncbi:hypothetical protein [Sphingopyxis sp.]|uniref:hypothetical protein n=1 Tax=Sphingopyxis sp. TaxID=1908224 RepID=UPI003D6CF075